MAVECPLDEVVLIDVITSSPITGAATDADSTPTFAVYEETTDTDIGVGGNFTKRTSLTGNYRAQFTASAANGFELGKFYSVIASATVGAVAGKCVVRTFRVVVAEAVAGYPVSDATKLAGQTITAAAGVTFPTSVASPTNITAASGVALSTAGILAIWHQLTSAIVTASTIGKLIVDFLDATISSRTKPADTQARVTLVDTLTAQTGNTPQTGDSFARIGAAGAGLTALGDTRIANLDAVVSTRSSHSAADVWASGTRTLSSFGSLVADVATAVWGAAVRTLSAFGFSVTASTVSDKTGYSLTSAYDPAQTAAQTGDAMTLTSAYDPAKTAAQPGDAMDLVDSPNQNAIDTLQADLATSTEIAALSLSIPTAEQIALAVYLRKITFDSDTGEFVIWQDGGLVEAGRLTPTTDAGALPIVGMEPV